MPAHNAEVTAGADAVGVAFPISDFKQALLAGELIRKLRDIDRSSVFAVGTCGFVVQMPHNGLGGSTLGAAGRRRLYDRAEAKCSRIADYVTSRRTGTVEREGIFMSRILTGRFVTVIPRVVPGMYHVLEGGWDAFAFRADELCDSCTVCAKVCPVT